VRSPTLALLRAYLAGGATTTSFPRGGRLALAAAVCAVPAYFVVRLPFQPDGQSAMACVLAIALSGAPAVAILPALRHDPEHAGREEIAQRRHEREMDALVGADEKAHLPESTWTRRPTPPTRW